MIKIKDKFYINADSNCYSVLEENGVNKKGESIYKTIGYYGTIEQALSGFLKYITRDYISKKEINSIKELKDEINKQTEFLKSLDLNV